MVTQKHSPSKQKLNIKVKHKQQKCFIGHDNDNKWLARDINAQFGLSLGEFLDDLFLS